MTSFNFQQEIAAHLDIIRSMQTPSGAFLAAPINVPTGYDKSWLRDNYFITLGFLETGNYREVKDAAKALLTVFVKHKDKISWAIENRPHESWQYIHARFNPETFEEYWEEWGNRQNDAVGEVLNLIVDLELRGEGVVESADERAMVQHIVDYLVTLAYWNDPDNGIWEENVEVHASSIGAVVAALKKADQLEWVTVPAEAITRGEQALRELLPRESDTKFVDLALLSLIYPFAVTTEDETAAILSNVEYHLLRDRGNEGARTMFSMAMWMAALVAPLQLVAGDLHGLNTLEHQPAKVAAMEGHFETQEGAPLILFGLPDMQAGETRYAVEIPKLGSWILTHDWNGEITGLNAFDTDERPNAAIVFWSFRAMVGIGLLMIATGLVSLHSR